MKPMLARLVRELPEDERYLFEPKWDGFRCLARRSGAAIELKSRQGRPLGRYFPELVAALAGIDSEPWTIDGEILLAVDGRFDFQALMGRLHPAESRVRELAARLPASFVAFDLPFAAGQSLCERGFGQRRQALETLLGGADPPLYLTPATDKRRVAARWLEQFRGGGIDGVVAKHRDLPYKPGARAMLKVKHERTADCVVGGVRLVLEPGVPTEVARASDPPQVASLLLGLYDDRGALEHIGVASSFTNERRQALARDVSPLAVAIEGHPWEHGFLIGGGPMGRLKGAAGRWVPGMTMDWVPLRPELVAEFSYTHVDGHRLRHPARFVRWRPDRDPRSCLLDQLDEPADVAAQVLAAYPPGLAPS
jgi:ATP-dependent DNA ligase